VDKQITTWAFYCCQFPCFFLVLQDYVLHLNLQTYTYVLLELPRPADRTRPAVTNHDRSLRQGCCFSV
jgi:hypothetical protein